MPEVIVKTPMPMPMAIDNWYGRRRFGPFSVVGDAFVLITHTTLVVRGSPAPTHEGFQPNSLSLWRAANVRSAVVSAVEFTNAGGKCLEELARDGWNVVDSGLETTLRHHQETNVGICDNGCGARALVEQ